MTFKYYDSVDLEGMVARFRKGYLSDTGWLRSADIKEAVDNHGPIPWYTYPALEMLSSIIRPNMQVFEYGGGGSTLWWSKQVSRVVSVDHDADWVAQTSAGLRNCDSFETVPINASCSKSHQEFMEAYYNLGLKTYKTGDAEKDLRRGLLDREFSAYAATLMKYPRETFDIVCVDGMARNLTAWIAAQYVKPEGFIIFDNAEREDYDTGYEVLRQAGYVRIDFTGPGPINPYAWTTSIWTKTVGVFKK